MLLGRRAERDRIDRLLDEAAAGRGGALVIRGEAGIGRTALLQYARDRAAGTATVVQATGVESELELPFAGLADVLRPLLSCIDELEGSQQELVRGLVAIGPSRAADRFAQATAALALLAAAARSTMLLVLVDDAHWLDSSSRDALLFAARRLNADAVAMLFTTRDDEEVPFEASGVDAVLLSGLALDEAAELLVGIVDADAVETLIGLTQGNPLALLELPATLSEAQLHGRAPLAEPPRVGAGVQRAFLRRVLVLGEEVRRALLVAAADDSGAIGVVETACGLLGLDAAALRRAEEAGLVIVDGGGIAFRHPLVRATVYHSAAPSERREAHSALAHAVDGRDELRRAWHAAAAAAGPDERAAGALAAVAATSLTRGAYGSASAAFDRAARLTPDRDEAAAFFAGAAEAAWQGGRTADAIALVAEGLSLGTDGSTRAELLACRGQMALLGEDQEAAYDNLLEAARLLEENEPTRAADLLAEAIGPGVQISGTAVSEAASRLNKLRTVDDPLRELLIAQGLLAATSVGGDVGGRERVELALTAAKEAGVLDGSRSSSSRSPEACSWSGRTTRRPDWRAGQSTGRATPGPLRSSRRHSACSPRRTTIAVAGGRRMQPRAKGSSSGVSSSSMRRSAPAWAFSPTSTQPWGMRGPAAPMRRRRSRSVSRGASVSTASARNAHSGGSTSPRAEFPKRSKSSSALTPGLLEPETGS